MNRTTPMIVLLLALLLAGCGMVSTDPEATTLRYGGGIRESTNEFKGTVAPGTTNMITSGTGMGDNYFPYPNTQRSWIAASTKAGDGFKQANGADRAAYECVTQDDVRMLVDTALYFELNSNEGVLRQFHERIGRKQRPGAWTTDGWEGWLLPTYFDTPLERIVVETCGNYESDDLRGNSETRRSFATNLTSRVSREIARIVGGDYFCGVGEGCPDINVEVGRPELVNQRIVEAEEQKQIAANNAEAQLARNTEIENALKAKRQEVELYGAENYVLLEAIKSGQVQFMQLPEGGTVAVPAGGGGQ